MLMLFVVLAAAAALVFHGVKTSKVVDEAN